MLKPTQTIRSLLLRSFRTEKLMNLNLKTEQKSISIESFNMARIMKNRGDQSVVRNWILSYQEFDRVLTSLHFNYRNIKFENLKEYIVRYCERDPITTLNFYFFFFQFESDNKMDFFQDRAMEMVFRHHLKFFLKYMEGFDYSQVECGYLNLDVWVWGFLEIFKI